jgi:hypothetical protein
VRKTNASGDKTPSYSATARGLFNQQQSQFCNFGRFLDEKDAANFFAILLCYPAALWFGFEFPYKGRDNFRNQPLKFSVPTVFFGVDFSVTLDDPAHVACLWFAREDSRIGALQPPVFWLHGNPS